jgi:hypothetical protein
MLATLKTGKKRALLHVVCLRRRLPGSGRDEAIKERPKAQDRKISAVWQALFSSDSQTHRELPFRPSLAARFDACCHERASQSEANRAGMPEPSSAAIHRLLPHASALGCSRGAAADGTGYTQASWLETEPPRLRLGRRHAEAKTRQTHGRRLEDLSARRSFCTPRRCMPKAIRSSAAHCAIATS